jgi:4a-hydroxytetrahydrobiopterin dehydratase
MVKLVEMRCTPYGPREAALTAEEVARYRSQVPEWEVVEREDVLRLERAFSFPDFVQALAFTNRVGGLAEAEDHHPALLTEWGRVTVSWWTHKVVGLHLNDLIAAAKTDRLYGSG